MSSRSVLSSEQVARWAMHKQVLMEWRRLEVEEPRWRNIRRVGDMVEPALRGVLGDCELPCASELLECWQRCAGEFNARHARPVGWRRRELIIEVDHPALRFELLQHAEMLLRALQRELGEGRVARLRFRLSG